MKPAQTKSTQAPAGRPPARVALPSDVLPDPQGYRASALRLREYVGALAERLARGEALDHEARAVAVKVLRTFAARPLAPPPPRPKGRPAAIDPMWAALAVATRELHGGESKSAAEKAEAKRLGVSLRALQTAIGPHYVEAVAWVGPSATDAARAAWVKKAGRRAAIKTGRKSTD